jgi:GT2 family glycosyltransferase
MAKISTIIPTIGRPESLRDLLDSLVVQTHRPNEIFVADGSGGDSIVKLLSEPHWLRQGLLIKHIQVVPPNAVRQREAAIKLATGDLLLLLDDDVVLEPDCIQHMIGVLDLDQSVVGVVADFNNQAWAMPTRVWSFYLRHIVGLREGEWQGRVVGPLLRFGYNPPPVGPMPMDWLATCNSLVRRSAYDLAGGFSDFFLHRCTMNEDVDLGLKLCRFGRILFCPAARMAHHHAPGGRVSVAVAAEDDLYNRFLVLRRTCRLSATRTVYLVSHFLLLESTSHFLGSVKRGSFRGFFPRLWGRLRGLIRVVFARPALKTGQFQTVL